jgi:hypothetical protein
VKVLKTPRFDMAKLLEMHGEVGATTTEGGAPVARTGEFVEPTPVDTV